ncbi:molybdopterin oxidoreductase family protein [Halomarina salina]|uniref:Molybdopterin oxidoreductase family protein n=1 Tax=Halomarina salina TaxID=1872699 RepID=A0ABD5RNI1_9EURY|nr:molybdopterin-dependent oxidoreductase [Halomarina salina]
MADSSDESETVCPLCAVGCRLTPGEGGRARGRTGPANPDGRLCAKGATAFETVADDERLTRPLVRRDGDLVAVDWATALDEAADRLGSVRDARGPDALAFFGAPHCTNEENYLLAALARTLGTNNVDNRARLCHGSAAGALERRFGWPASTNTYEDLAESDLVLVAGANPAVQQPVAFDAFVRAAGDDDRELVHVDPRRNETTRAADRYLAPRPGTDALFFHLVCATLLDRGAVDETFVEARTTGFDAFAAALTALDVERAAAATGVDAEEIRNLADRIAAADRVVAMGGTGIEDDEGSPTADAILDLLTLTGNVGRPGTGFTLLRGLNNEQGATDTGCRPDRLPGHASLDDEAARDRLASVWGTEPPTTPGLDEREALAAFGESVFGTLVVGENPAVAKRDDAWVADRFESLDALVVVDAFETETTEHADVVLPAAVGLEKSGTVTNIDRRVQRLAPTADPPGEARADFDVLVELADRLVEEWTPPATSAVASDELRTVVAPYADLSDDVGERWPRGRGDALYAESFDTPDGRAAFGSVEGRVDPPGDDELVLVVGSRAGGFDGPGEADDRLGLNAADAERLDVADGDRVRVEAGEANVETVADVGDAVRRGTVYLHADVADPLVRSGRSAVRVTPVGEP